MLIFWIADSLWVVVERFAAVIAIPSAAAFISVMLRRRWKKHKADQDPVVLGHIVPPGFDAELRQLETRLLLTYLKRVRSETETLAFPGTVRRIPMEKLLVTLRVSLNPKVLLGRVFVTPTKPIGNTDNPSVDLQLESGTAVDWPSVKELDETFLIMGPAGTGKTTLLRHEAFNYANALLVAGPDWRDITNPIPVIIRAADFAECIAIGMDFREVVGKKLVDELRSAGESIELEALKALDRCVTARRDKRGFRILLEALDECASEHDRSLVIRTLQSYLTSGGWRPNAFWIRIRASAHLMSNPQYGWNDLLMCCKARVTA